MTIKKRESLIRELDEVEINAERAYAEGVERQGTIVWYVQDAPYATVECAILGELGPGVMTKLLDVEVEDLRII